ncbi:MAG: hypothetical protein JW909_03525 [Planctomycetes bacterium]|nr:hypothetical protein [Planctomycetota bacterium]
MYNSGIPVFIALGWMLFSGGACGGEADPVEKIKEAVTEAAGKGGGTKFFIDYFGAPARATLISADANEVNVEVMGQEVGVAWEGFAPRRLYGLARKFRAEDAAYRMVLARYCVANDLVEEAESELQKAAELDTGEIREEAYRLAARLHPAEAQPEVPAAAPPPASRPAPAGSGKDLVPPRGGWVPIGFSGGGAMFTPAISHKGRMFVNCDMSPAFISNDKGRTWKMIHHAQIGGNTRCRPCFHPANDDIIYAAGGYWGALKMSRDGGETWTAAGKPSARPAGEIAMSPGNPSLMMIGTAEGVDISRDGGATWKKCNGPAGEGVGFHFDQTGAGANRTIFAATAQGIWRSDDGGQTWQEKTGGLPWKDIRSFAGGSNAGTGEIILYCVIPGKNVDGAYDGGVYKSSDRGEQWVSAMGEGINQDLKAHDQWSQAQIATYTQVLTTNVKPKTVYANNLNTGFWPPHHTTCFRSDDAGGTWRATLYYDPRFKADQYNVSPNYHSYTLGQSYQEPASGAAICPGDPDILIRVGGMKCFTTLDGGKTWNSAHNVLAPDSPPGPRSTWLCNGLVVTSTWHYYIDPFEHNRHYIAYTDIGFGRSVDGGKSWHWWNREEWAPWRNTCYELAFDPEIPGKVWGTFTDVHDIPNGNIVGGRHWNNSPERGPGGMCVSTDFAAHWQKSMEGLPMAPCCSVAVDGRSPKGNRTLYAAVLEHGVYKSTDDGKTWTRKSQGLGAPGANQRVCRVLLHADGTLFALVTGKRTRTYGPFVKEGAGLYRSADGGESWEHITASNRLDWPKDFDVHPKDSRHILLGAADANDKSGGLYRTTDGGATWQRLASKGPETFGGYFHPTRSGWIYMSLCEGSPGTGLWLSRDSGRTWEGFDALPFSNIQRPAFDPDDPSVLYVTTFGGSVWKGPIAPGGAETGSERPE